MIRKYGRVSTKHQNLDRQVLSLNAYGDGPIYLDKASGKSLGRPEMDRLLGDLKPGDVVVVAEWDRATRSMVDGIFLIDKIINVGAFIKVLDKPHLDFTTTIGKGIVALLSALAQDERERIIKRSGEGRKLAKERGVRFGRKRKLTPHQRELAKARIAADESHAAIAADFNVDRSTITRLGASA